MLPTRPEGFGLSRSTLRRWRSGTTSPSRRDRDRLARSPLNDGEWGLPFDSSSWMRAVRQDIGLGQNAFANECGVTQATVSKWESGDLLLDREAASRISDAFDISECLVPREPEPVETEGEAWSSYQRFSSLRIIQSSAQADWEASELCAALTPLSNRSPEAARILGSVYANRSLWHLVFWEPNGAVLYAKRALRLGARSGFMLDTGYALWTLARTRFLQGFGSEADIAALTRMADFSSSSHEQAPKPYGRLLAGALAMARGEMKLCAFQMAAAQDEAPSQTSLGIVSRWTEDYWRRDISIYHAMLALCSGYPVECLRLIEPVAETPWGTDVPNQYVQSIARHYCKAAWAQIGSRERVELDGPAVGQSLQDVIRRHATRVSGFRFRA